MQIYYYKVKIIYPFLFCLENLKMLVFRFFFSDSLKKENEKKGKEKQKEDNYFNQYLGWNLIYFYQILFYFIFHEIQIRKKNNKNKKKVRLNGK